MDIITMKNLSPGKPSECSKGHKYPEEYDKECKYCVAIFGLNTGE